MIKQWKGSNNMKHFFIVVYFIIVIGDIYPQEWVSNYINKYFDYNNIVSYDIARTNNIFWIIDIDGYLYKFQNSSTSKFYTSFEDNTNLDEFNTLNRKLKIEPKYYYTKLVSNDNVLWLIDEKNFQFVKIVENRVYIYEPKNEELDFKYFDIGKVDNNGDLFFTCNYYKSSIFVSKLYKIETTIKEVNSIKLNDRFIKAIDFCENDLCIVRDSPVQFIVFNKDSYEVVKEIHLDSSKYENTIKSFYSSNNNILYFLFGKGDMLTYTNCKVNYYDLHVQNLLECYWFVVFDKYIFLSFSGGLFIYNTENNKFIKQSLEFEGQRYVSYKNILIHDRQLYGQYGNVNPTKCVDLGAGIGILNFQNFDF